MSLLEACFIFPTMKFSMISTGDITQQRLEKIDIYELVIPSKILCDAMQIERMQFIFMGFKGSQ
jgi:hypothetical protein